MVGAALLVVVVLAEKRWEVNGLGEGDDHEEKGYCEEFVVHRCWWWW